MQVKAFKLPPLPSKKNNGTQLQNKFCKNPEPQSNRRYFLSRQKRQTTQGDKNPSQQNKYKRPNSVHSVSRQSLVSRDSKYSRGSSRERSIQLQTKQKAHYNVKARISMPLISAKSWAVYQMKQSKYIYGKRICKRREVASLTKIMNFITILELIQELDLEPTKVFVKVSRDASCIGGTTASLAANMEINLYDLYYGMMLPSGNDAAYQIAQIGGALINMMKNSVKKQTVYDIDYFTSYYQKQQFPVKIYLAQMNKVSKRIGMVNSNFANPHGLSNPENFSCAQDMCKLSSYCMENSLFRKVVITQKYSNKYLIRKYQQIQKDLYSECGEKEIINPYQKQNQPLEVIENIQREWENTNKMLIQNWSGIKTGITPNAGPCLAASVIKHISGRQLQFLIILISSSSMEARWKQVKGIVQWVIDQKLYF